jgi:hypothetical protein
MGGGGELASGGGYCLGGFGGRHVATGGVADPDGLLGFGISVFGEPDAGGVAAAEEAGGAVAGSGEIVGDDQNVWGL